MPWRRFGFSCLAVMLASGCGKQPVGTAPTAVTPPPPLPAAPKAVLTVDSGGSTPALGIERFTSFVFDASRSTGDGLSYVIELGNGTTSTQAVTSRVIDRRDRGTAKLTVTDRFGRSDSITEPYFVAFIENRLHLTFWFCSLPNGRVTLTIMEQNASAISGWYHETGALNKRFAGSLTDRRTLRLQTEDGSVELNGTLEWKPVEPFSMSQSRVVLRLAVRGGLAGGATSDFHFGDPY